MCCEQSRINDKSETKKIKAQIDLIEKNKSVNLLKKVTEH